jgi:tetrapyrrole methylase family protein / MazG family protein
MTGPGKPPASLDDLQKLLARLRGPRGCPWDRKQDPESLKIYLLEETYELAEALDRDAASDVREELGDLLFLMLFICRIYEERGAFDLHQVMEKIQEKMVRRHPHVFGDTPWRNPEEVAQGWQGLKAEEKPEQTPFDSIPEALPSLLKAHRLSQRAAGLGFDWPDIRGVLEKVHEELAEVEEAVENRDLSAAQEELGDLLFALVNLGRFLGIHSENALRKTNQKFLNRFLKMLIEINTRKVKSEDLSSEEWEALWNRSKETSP